MKTIKKIYMQNREIIDYLFWGVMTTCVSWLTYIGAIRLFGFSVAVSNALSWTLATIFAFVVNKLFVFHSTSFGLKLVFRELFLFVSSRFVTGLFEIISVPLLVDHGFNFSLLGTKGLLTKIIVSFIVVVMNYCISKLLIFRKS